MIDSCCVAETQNVIASSVVIRSSLVISLGL